MSTDRVSELPDLPRLNFLEASTERDKIRRFVSVVHSALVNRTQHNLNGFSVEFEYHECFASDVDTWLEFAANYHTRELKLLLCSTKYLYELPQMMYSNSSLQKLSLQRCNLAPLRNSIEWPSLRSIEIVDAELSQHLIEKILSNCPVLSSLKLDRCRGFSCLDIKSKGLDNLEIYDVGEEGLLEISAPNLIFLTIWMMKPKERKLYLKDISSLRNASLDLINDHDLCSQEMMNKVDQLLQQVKHVPELTLGNGIIQVISRMVASGWPLPRSSVKHLTVTPLFHGVEQEFYGVVDLLESSPKLESLTIFCSNYSEEAITWGLTAEDDSVDDLVNLKTISIFGFPYGCCELLLTITRILLKRAIVLEKMAIDLYQWPPECYSELTQKLQSYPKSSQKAQLHFRRD